ncbi:MAG TPA: alpha/beta hydrolase [Longimicrobiales bacterium]|nr:alpha/beta hydrolase [Longimicrobiales bacterium]
MAFRARRAVTWIALPAVVYLAWAAFLFLAQRSMIYPGARFPAPSEGVPGPGAETWTLATSSGPVEAWYHPPRHPRGDASRDGRGRATAADGREASPTGGAGPAAAVLFAHGNGERIDDWAGAFRPLARAGVAVLLVEYPGYGRSAGTPSQASVTEALIEAWDRLADRPEVDPDRIVGLGRSLGGGAVAVLARERPLRALVLQSTFTSVRDFARRYLLPGFLVRDPFDALAAVRRFEGPVLVTHGTGDRVVPWEHGRRLAEAAPRGTFVSYACAHNDCPPDWEEWLGELVAFLEGHGILPTAEDA